MIRPTLDVTEVLLSPEFADEFQVVRRIQGTTTNGEPYIARTDIFKYRDGCIGVVTPSSENSLVRADAYEAQSNSVQVITKFRLQGAAKDGKAVPATQWLPDLIVWRDNHYIVRMTNDYSRFGAGFIVADCLLTEYIPQRDTQDDSCE